MTSSLHSHTDIDSSESVETKEQDGFKHLVPQGLGTHELDRRPVDLDHALAFLGEGHCDGVLLSSKHLHRRDGGRGLHFFPMTRSGVRATTHTALDTHHISTTEATPVRLRRTTDSSQRLLYSSTITSDPTAVWFGCFNFIMNESLPQVWRALVGLNVFVSVLSLLGALLIITFFILYKDLRTFGFKLVFFSSVCDLIFSIAQVSLRHAVLNV